MKFRQSSLLALAAILGLIVLVAGLLLIHRGDLLNLIYPVGALLAAGVLYVRYPALYVGFVWWVWFLTPEVRRLVDWQSSWHSESTVMLTPFLVTGLTFFTLLRHSPKLQDFPFLPIGMAVAGLLYGFGVGVFTVGLGTAAFDLINWVVPVVFAFYLLVNSRDYPVYRRVTQRTFAWGLLVMGLYGLLQFMDPPIWDQAWMQNAPMASIGTPEPFKVRVFSTLNSPGPYALVVMAGLLMLLSRGALQHWPSLVAGAVSLLLSLVRSSWLGFLVGLCFLAAYRGRSRLRLLATLVVVGLIAWPLLSFGPLGEVINNRLETLGDIEQDVSFQERLAFYEQIAPRAFFNPLGEGLGNTGVATKLANEGGGLGDLGNFDSGILAIAFGLGWLGTLLYAGGLIWLYLNAIHGTKRPDLFAAASCAIVTAVLVQLFLGNVATGVSGVVLWYFLGLAVAARVFHAQDAGNTGQRSNLG
jgi:hypothetical protein